MKTIQLLLFLLPFSIKSFGQDDLSNIEQTKAENFSAKTGILIQKTFDDIGEWKGVKVQNVNYQDLSSKQAVESVVLKFKPSGQYASTKTAVLDSDEVEDLLRAFELLKELIQTAIPETYTEVSFKSRGGFETGCFVSKGKWTPYIQLDESDRNSCIFLKQEDLDKFIDLFKQTGITE